MLNPNGIIIVKENISQVEEGEIDSEDSSITRSFVNFCTIFQQANLKCIAKKTQKNFPSGLYKVEMFALKPVGSESTESNQISWWMLIKCLINYLLTLIELMCDKKTNI